MDRNDYAAIENHIQKEIGNAAFLASIVASEPIWLLQGMYLPGNCMCIYISFALYLFSFQVRILSCEVLLLQSPIYGVMENVPDKRKKSKTAQTSGTFLHCSCNTSVYVLPKVLFVSWHPISVENVTDGAREQHTKFHTMHSNWYYNFLINFL